MSPKGLGPIWTKPRHVRSWRFAMAYTENEPGSSRMLALKEKKILTSWRVLRS